MKRRTVVKGILGIGTVGAIGSAATTSSTVDRDIEVPVVADYSDTAGLRLDEGTVDGASFNSEQLLIHGQVSDGSGDSVSVTPNGTFVYGDDDDPSAKHAFVVGNQLDVEREVGVDVNTDGETAVVDVDFYNTDGELIGSTYQVTSTFDDDITQKLEADASIPDGVDMFLTIYATGDDQETTIELEDGHHQYTIDDDELDLSTVDEIRYEIETNETGDPDSDPEVHSLEILAEEEDSTALEGAGETFLLEPFASEYSQGFGVVTIDTSPLPDGNESVTGEIKITAAADVDAGDL